MELISDGMAGQLHAKELEIARGVDQAELPDDPAQAVPLWFGMFRPRSPASCARAASAFPISMTSP
jgi:hypothetical protein